VSLCTRAGQAASCGPSGDVEYRAGQLVRAVQQLLTRRHALVRPPVHLLCRRPTRQRHGMDKEWDG
jgi:hypothetical protein